MLKDAIKKIAKGAAGVFVKKVTTVDQEGEETTRTRPREGVKGIAWICGFLVLWHFLIQPVLAHHFPDYSFPALDGGWISGILLGF